MKPKITSEKLSEGIQKLFSDKPHRPNHYGVTELLYCPKKAYYSRTKLNKPKSNGFMLSGVLLHEKFQDLMKYTRVKDAKYEMEASKQINVNGTIIYIDGRVDALTKNDAYELKFTTVNPDTYRIPIQYLLQANAYAVMAGVDNYHIITIFSPSLEVQIHSGEKREESFNTLIERATKLHEDLKNNVLPEGPIFEWECKHCYYYDTCKQIKED
jgi:CRISPR/Cas system-associated exonuclease Cas4 (RecB family)